MNRTVRQKEDKMTHKHIAPSLLGSAAWQLHALVLLLLMTSVVICRADLAAGLVAFYPFNGNANDESGNENHGIVYGAALTDDRFGTANSAYSFSNSYIRIPNSSAINFNTSDDFTCSVWVKIPPTQNDLGAEDNAILEKWSFNPAYPFVIRYMNESRTNRTSQVVANRYDGQHGPTIGSVVTLNDNEFHQIAFVKRQSNLFLYVDGHLASQTNDTTTASTQNTSDLYIGRRGVFTSMYDIFYRGVIDDIRIYNRALSATEIALLAEPILGSDTYEQPVERMPDPPAPENQPEYDSLVIVTHGYQPLGALADVSWIDNIADDIRARLVSQGMSNWLVYPFPWKTFAWPDPETALANGDLIGGLLGTRIGHQSWQHVHLIGHSAGSALIQSAAEKIKKLSSGTTVHTTFLDPFVGISTEGRLSYGHNSDWSDNYFSQDATGYTTKGKLDNSFNVDVTGLDPSYTPLLLFSGMAGSTPAVQTRSSTSHSWPHEFYANTIPPDSQQGSQGLGFPLSKEGSGWEDHASHPVGDDPVTLGSLNPIPVSPYEINNTPPLNFTSIPFNTSISGASIIGGDRFDMSVALQNPGPLSGSRLYGQAKDGTNSITSNAWVSVSAIVTQAINFVAFDLSFTSPISSEGLLTVYWDTNILGVVDERVAQEGVQTYRMPLPGIVDSGVYALGFRLDAFTNDTSSVSITNVLTGFAGNVGSMTLGIVSSTNDVVMSLSAPSNCNYIAHSSTNLVDWVPFAILANTNGSVSFYEPNAAVDVLHFYKVTRPSSDQ